MDSDFKFFYSGVCNDDQPIYGLIDLIDNHFMIQSHSAEYLFEVKELIKSKTRLEIVDLSQYRYNKDNSRITDNWVIEQWGIDLDELNFRIDPLTSKRFKEANKKESYVLNIPAVNLKPATVNFDSYKSDLQKQIFFTYFFVSNYEASKLAKLHFKKIFQTSMSYQEMLEQLLDVKNAPLPVQVELLFFIRRAGIAYE